jgi:hypothetical protein
MERQISRLRELSSDLLARLDQSGFDDIEAFMEQRNAVFSEMIATRTQQGVDLEAAAEVRNLLEMDRVIMERMQTIHRQLGEEIQKIQAGKKSKSLYEKYNATYEGDFFDSKR